MACSLDAMREAARTIPIVGVNATPEGVAAIKAGEAPGRGCVRRNETGVPGRRGRLRALAGERVPAEILLPIAVVERANCGAWHLPYRERPLLDWSECERGERRADRHARARNCRSAQFSIAAHNTSGQVMGSSKTSRRGA